MKSLSLAKALSECRRIGYRNVELALIAGFPTEPARLSPEARADVRRELADAKVPVSSLLINLSLAADEKANASHLENLELAARFAAEISPGSPPIVQTVMGGAPREWEEKKAVMASRLREWDAIARKHGVTVAVKAHVSSAVNSPERLLWAIRQAKGSNLAVAYDHSHYALAGISIAESLRPLAPHTKFVHIKDARMDGKDVRFLLPGEGTTDYAEYFRLLRAVGYRGPCVVEVSSQIFNRPGYDPIAAAEKCYAALAPSLRP
ncbi:MAG: sugar phosphate isomerase/epimerase [Opitutaceae bacterium]|nr:sugar phosphate isomerase/epimerase [Opitutaceae bacterium]